MLKVIQTNNAQLVREIMTDEKVWEKLSEDHAPDRETWMPDMRYPWLVFTREQGDLVEVFGVGAWIPQTPIIYKFHPVFVPDKWGSPKLIEFGKLAAKWLWDHTTAQKAVVQFPVTHKGTLKLGQQVGYKREGINRKSFLKNGELIDQYYLGLTRE